MNKKENVNYDDLRDFYQTMEEQGGSSWAGTMAKTALKAILPGSGLLPIPRWPDPTTALLKALFDKFFSDPVDFSDDDAENIEHLIEEGRRQGLEEMEIRVSKDLGGKMGLSANVPLEGVPVGVTANVEKKNNGDYIIHVKFRPKTHLEDVQAIKEYEKLFKDGTITKKQLEKKKKDILGN
jgi:hypothetical protein